MNMRRALFRLISFFRSGQAERGLAREIESHLQLLEDGYRAQGLSAAAARQAAKRAFGGVEQAKERQRDARSFRWLDNSWLDLKLGARMLIKDPGLALVGGLGMAVAMTVAVGGFVIIGSFTNPALPLHEGDRVVALQLWDTAVKSPERRILHDFAAWREQLTAVEDVGAFRQVGRNLIAPGRQTEVVRVAEMSASGFRVARVPPLLGRHLVEADEREGAPAVVVVGYGVWRTRFESDPAVIGRTVQLGAVVHTVVGVMPDGFAFPVSHSFWTPLRLDPAREPRTGPALTAFARLAPGVTLQAAQSELGALGQRIAASSPATHEKLRPTVLPYTYPFFDIDEPAVARAFRLVRFTMALLLIVVAVNVAILVYARTARRQGEIALRSALGASRSRIVSQLFLEALVLSGAAAAVALVLTRVAFRYLNAAMAQAYGQVPFWWEFRLSIDAGVYAAALSALAAAIVGVVPALKATGPRVQGGLRVLGAGGSGMQLGRTWTVLIAAQVAFAVALLPGAVYQAWSSMQYGITDPGFAAAEILTTGIVMDRSAVASAKADQGAGDMTAADAARHGDLLRRLATEPAVARVTFARHVPTLEGAVFLEAEGVAMPAAEADYSLDEGTARGHLVRMNRVDPGFFETFDARILTGRGFQKDDSDAAAAAVIVSRSFVQQVLGGGAALGRRVRYVGRGGDAEREDVELGRWYEIVGVVSDFAGSQGESGPPYAKLYHAAAPGQLSSGTLIVRLRGTTPAAYTSRLREISAAVDPNMQLRNPLGMDAVLRQDQEMMRLVAAALAAVTLSVVLLSAAGIYALMSFTVAQRRKEIGIRTALGADPRHILGSIFSRAVAQLATGVLFGVVVAALIDVASGGELMQGNGPIVLPLVAALMSAVGLLAAMGPARRGLRIHPTEALREP